MSIIKKIKIFNRVRLEHRKRKKIFRMPDPLDVEAIKSETRFSTDFMLPPGRRAKTVSEASKIYLSELALGTTPRRPEPGFNPHVYASHQFQDDSLIVGAYADFIRRGRPSGPWMKEIIERPVNGDVAEVAPGLRCALHVHAYYVDDLPQILSHLCANRARPSIYASVIDTHAQAFVEQALRTYDGPSTVRVVPNKGRDIGPFLTEFGAELIDGYDVIGHVHTKRSLHMENKKITEDWVSFIFQNVLGGGKAGAMLDRILSAFSVNSELGLVFPSDPCIISWSENEQAAHELAPRLGLSKLPNAFDFPVGTMFWMRAAALKPFVQLDLRWDDYPLEPVPNDGTMLHALERLFGVVPEIHGFQTAVTYVKGVTR